MGGREAGGLEFTRADRGTGRAGGERIAGARSGGALPGGAALAHRELAGHPRGQQVHRGRGVRIPQSSMRRMRRARRCWRASRGCAFSTAARATSATRRPSWRRSASSPGATPATRSRSRSRRHRERRPSMRRPASFPSPHCPRMRLRCAAGGRHPAANRSWRGSRWGRACPSRTSARLRRAWPIRHG